MVNFLLDLAQLFPLKLATVSNPDCATPADSPDDYVAWLNRRIGQEVKRLRLSTGLSAYCLANQCGISDQTFLNVERGTCPNGCLTSVLARISHRFGLQLWELIQRAEHPPDPPNSFG